MNDILIIAFGGGVGAVLRYIISNLAAERFGTLFPYGTLLVNIIGCFIIGLFMTMLSEKFTFPPYTRLLITVGFLGGLTTFSSFSYETIKLIQSTQYFLALTNAGLNFILSFTATFLGIFCARLF